MYKSSLMREVKRGSDFTLRLINGGVFTQDPLGALNASGVNFLYLYTFPIIQTFSARGPKLNVGFHVKLFFE